MKLSQVDPEKLSELSVAQKTAIVYGEPSASDFHAEFAVLLGGRIDKIQGRIEAAGRLWLEKKVDWIIPTGGVDWPYGDGTISEVEFMKRGLLAMGVPEEAILLEENARTTRENMICSLLVMMRKINLSRVKCVVIVTSPYHLRRSMFFAKWLIPKNITVLGHAALEPNLMADTWHLGSDTERVDRELGLLRKVMNEVIFGDIEFPSSEEEK